MLQGMLQTLLSEQLPRWLAQGKVSSEQADEALGVVALLGAMTEPEHASRQPERPSREAADRVFVAAIRAGGLHERQLDHVPASQVKAALHRHIKGAFVHNAALQRLLGLSERASLSPGAWRALRAAQQNRTARSRLHPEDVEILERALGISLNTAESGLGWRLMLQASPQGVRIFAEGTQTMIERPLREVLSALRDRAPSI